MKRLCVMFCCVVSLGCFSQKHHLIDLELQAEEYFQDYDFDKALQVYFEIEKINDTLIGSEESFNMGSIELIRNLNMEEKRILRTRLMKSVDKFKTDKLKHNWKKIFNE